MKRGLIQWDRSELAASVFEARLASARHALLARQLPALVVYTDVWRSNQARFLTNFMPYWNRSLVVIPRDHPPALLCGLSPRVYPWIRSVTVFEDIRPAGKLAPTLLQLCAEHQWSRIGVLDLPCLPHEVYQPLQGSVVELVDVPSAEIEHPDHGELSMRRRAVQLAREILSRELPNGAGISGCEFAGRLERAFRRAGAEDLIILISTGDSVPAPANGHTLGPQFSVAVALEYCGHWVKVTRSQISDPTLREQFEAALNSTSGGFVENLSGPYPYEAGRRGPIFALHVESRIGDRRLFYGDTCRQTDHGAELL